MKYFILSLALLLPVVSHAQLADQTYQAVKYMIENSTQTRIQAFEAGDLSKVCKTTNVEAPVDTMPYYISFEFFDVPDVRTRLYADLGFAAQALESMYRSNLPRQLHEACISKDEKAIADVMTKIKGIYTQE